MNTIIEKIRAKVERLMQEEQQEIKDMEGALVPNLRSYTKGKRDAFIDTLIVLDKLKELPITRDFNFDDEVVKWIQEHSDVDGTYSGIDFARHFYELGRQSKEQPLCEGLEEEFRAYCGDFKDPETGEELPEDKCSMDMEQARKLARHFAQWQKEKDERTLRKFFNDRNQGDASFYDLLAYREGHRDGMDEQKEQMMKEAVEGEVLDSGVNYLDLSLFEAEKLGLAQGDKFRFIIVKED